MWRFNFTRTSLWTVVVATLLTVILFVCLIDSQLFDTLAIFPSDFLITWYFTPFFTFWLVTNEHVTHWLTVLSLIIFDRLVRDCWSKLEICVFAAFVNLLSAFTLTLLLWLSSDSPSISVHGNAAMIAALTVVAMQFDAQRFLLGYGSVGLKSRDGFFVGLLLFFTMALLSIVSWISFGLYVFGFWFAWFYLRFLQHHPQRRYGDHRSCFAFSKFFPGPLETWIAVPSNMVYRLVLLSKLCPGIERQSEIVSTASFAVDIPGITSDADRHRQLALKALNERLFARDNSRTTPTEVMEWPKLDEPETTTPSTSSAEVPAGASSATVQSVVVDLTHNPEGQIT